MNWGDDQERLVANAKNLLIDYLNDHLAEQVGAWYPSDATPEAPQLPYLAVANDGAPISTALTMRFTLRFTAWHENPTPAFDLANAAHAAVMAYPGSPDIDTILHGVGIAEAVDDRTGHSLASFTARAVARYR